MRTAYIYTSRTNIKQNNKDIDALVELLKKKKISRRNYTHAAVMSKAHIKADFGVFKSGMDVIVMNDDKHFYRKFDKEFIFGLSDKIDYTEFTREELALIAAIKVTEIKDEYEVFCREAELLKNIEFTEIIIDPDPYSVPKEYQELFDTAYNKIIKSQEKKYARRTKYKVDPTKNPVIVEHFKGLAMDKVRTQMLKDKLLENPRLIYTLTEIERVCLNYADDKRWFKKLVKKDSTIITELPFFEMDRELARICIENDYTVFRAVPFRDYWEDKDFVLFVIDQKDIQGWSKDDCLCILSVVRTFNNNREVIEAAVAVDNREFAFASEELRANKDLILFLLDNECYGILKGISEKLRVDKNFVKKLHSIYMKIGNYDSQTEIGEFDLTYNSIKEEMKGKTEEEIILEAFKVAFSNE